MDVKDTNVKVTLNDDHDQWIFEIEATLVSTDSSSSIYNINTGCYYGWFGRITVPGEKLQGSSVTLLIHPKK